MGVTKLKNITKRIITGAAAVLLASPAFINSSVVSADKVSETKSAISAKKSSKSDLLAKFNAQQNKVAKLSNAVDNKVVAISTKQKDIKATESRITTLANNIKTTQTELANRKSVLRKQLVELQEQSTNSVTGNIYVDFVLNSADFSDLLSRSFALNKINDANQEAVTAVKESEQQLTSLKNEQADKKVQLLSDKKKLESEKKDLSSQKAEVEESQTELKEQIDANESALSSLQNDLSSTKTAVANLQKTATSAKTSKASAPVATHVSGNGAGIAQIAVGYQGVPYVYGGASPSGFDCSGLIYYSARRAGISLPRTSQAMSTVGSAVSMSSLQAGDLLFWGGTGSAYHVAVYIGGGSYVHAPAPGQSVTVQSLNSYRPTSARRL